MGNSTGLCLPSKLEQQAELTLKRARQRDLAQSLPVFKALNITKGAHRCQILDVFEAICHAGRGSLKFLQEDFHINRCDAHFFSQTFQYFDNQNLYRLSARERSEHAFTAPQFVICLWNFLSLSPPGLAEWTFRAYFGGPECAPSAYASCDQVFHMLDVIYGISKEYDFRPSSEIMETAMHTGNSHEYDVKRARNLVRSVCKRKDDPRVGIAEFSELVSKTPALLNRIFSVQVNMQERVIGESFWHKMMKRRHSCDEFDHAVKACLAENPHVFDHHHVDDAEEGGGYGASTKRHQGSYRHDANHHSDGRARRFVHKRRGAHAQRLEHKRQQENVARRAAQGKKNSRYAVPAAADGNGRAGKYVARVNDEGFTGPAHAHEEHHQAATKIQRTLSRGFRGRHKARVRRATSFGKPVGNWMETVEPRTGMHYWVNKKTNKTQFRKPKELC